MSSADVLIQQLIHSATVESPHIEIKSVNRLEDGDIGSTRDDEFLDDLFAKGFIEEVTSKLENAIIKEIVSCIK